MSMSNSIGRCRLNLCELESRVVPAARWPIAGGIQADQVIGTWGQYQDIQEPNQPAERDFNIHHHEGLDILAPSGTEVLAVMDGKITQVTGINYGTIVTIKDGNGKSGWNYKHVQLMPGYSPGKKVEVGKPFARIVPSPRSEIPDHVHLDRGTATDTGDRLEAAIAPNVNPLTEFDLGQIDQVKPTVESIGFRLAEDDKNTYDPATVSVPFGQITKYFGGQETPRKDARYFTATTAVNAVDAVRLGKYATTESNVRSRKTGSGLNTNSKIDIIANAYDLFGSGKLNSDYTA